MIQHSFHHARSDDYILVRRWGRQFHKFQVLEIEQVNREVIDNFSTYRTLISEQIFHL